MISSRPVIPVAPAEHAQRIKLALTALNDAVVAAAHEGVGTTYDTSIGEFTGKLPPTVLIAQVWCAL